VDHARSQRQYYRRYIAVPGAVGPTLPKVAAEIALRVLAYNLTRVMNIVGIKPLMPLSGREAIGRPEQCLCPGQHLCKRFYTTKTHS
jgi:hypothetical protein